MYRWKFRIWNSVLFYEDGSLFIPQALEHGLHSLFISYAGYFHNVARIIAWVATFLPSIIIPHFFVICCFLITLYVCSTILKKQYEWFIPDIRLRGILFLLMLIAPGTWDAFGSISDLHWLCYLYLGLLGLRNLNYKYKWWEILFIVLSVSTEGATLTLLPIFGIRLLFQILGKKGNKYYVQETLVILLISVMALINYSVRIADTNLQIPKRTLFEVFKHTFLEDFLSYPWLYKIPYKMMGEYWFIPTIYIAVFAIIIISKFFSWKPKIILPLVFFVCIVMIPTMISMARGFTSTLFIYHDVWCGMAYRYYFLICTGSYMFWIWIFSLMFSIKKTIILKYLFTLFIVLATIFWLRDYKYVMEPYQAENFWIKNAAKIDDVRKNMDNKKIVIMVFPNWTATIGNVKEEIKTE